MISLALLAARMIGDYITQPAWIYIRADDWSRIAILNLAGSDKFSSDCTIAQYVAEIWNAKPGSSAGVSES